MTKAFITEIAELKSRNAWADAAKVSDQGRVAWECVWDGRIREEHLVNPYNAKTDRKRYAAFRQGFEESEQAYARMEYGVWLERESSK